jgi:antiviral helicase SLH1
MTHDALRDDRSLNGKRHQLVLSAADSLVEARMIDHAKQSGSFTITDLGRIAAKYYIHHKSITIFNQVLEAHMTEERVLFMVSLSTEVSDFDQTPHRHVNGRYNDLQFDQIQVRDNETKELVSLLNQAPHDVEVSRTIVRLTVRVPSLTSSRTERF